MDLIGLLRRWAIPGTSRLLHRGAAEHEQALLRILLATLIAGYFGVARLLDSSLALGTNSIPVAVFGGYFLIALVLAIEVSRNPGPSPRRRVIGLIADNAAITACMSLSTLVGTPLFGMFLLVTFSNGFRFGNRYLLGSLAFSMAGFALVLAINPYWRELRPLGLDRKSVV